MAKHEHEKKESIGKHKKEHGGNGMGKKEHGFSSKVGKHHKMFGKEMSPAGK